MKPFTFTLQNPYPWGGSGFWRGYGWQNPGVTPANHYRQVVHCGQPKGLLLVSILYVGVIKYAYNMLGPQCHSTVVYLVMSPWWPLWCLLNIAECLLTTLRMLIAEQEFLQGKQTLVLTLCIRWCLGGDVIPMGSLSSFVTMAAPSSPPLPSQLCLPKAIK